VTFTLVTTDKFSAMLKFHYSPVITFTYACSRKEVAMQQVIDMPECSFCHSNELELFYAKANGLYVQCAECGFSATAANEHLASSTITLLAG
jgi:hypothetical protein